MQCAGLVGYTAVSLVIRVSVVGCLQNDGGSRESDVGTALSAAECLLRGYGGGKIVLFQHLLPSCGVGKLTTPTVTTLMDARARDVLLAAQTTAFYETKAVAFSTEQVCPCCLCAGLCGLLPA